MGLNVTLVDGCETRRASARVPARSMAWRIYGPREHTSKHHRGATDTIHGDPNHECTCHMTSPPARWTHLCDPDDTNQPSHVRDVGTSHAKQDKETVYLEQRHALRHLEGSRINLGPRRRDADEVTRFRVGARGKR